METDGRRDYLICKELSVGFVVTGLDCSQAREWAVYVRGRVNVPGCGWLIVCVHVRASLSICLCV